jgi:isoaspartyl peptidase/L-asparaginase-like protein (Ntn-hydrolase superfamily)
MSEPRIAGVGGVIVLDVAGRAGFAFSTSRMARAWIDGDGRSGAGVDPVPE